MSKFEEVIRTEAIDSELRRDIQMSNARTVSSDQARIDAQVEKTIAVRANATRIFGDDWSHDGKSIDAIRREVVAELEPDFKLEGRADSDVAVAYDILVSREDATDSKGETDEVAEARDAMVARNANKWKLSRERRHGDRVAPSPPAARSAANSDPDPVASARDAMVARNANKWKLSRGSR